MSKQENAPLEDFTEEAKGLEEFFNKEDIELPETVIGRLAARNRNILILTDQEAYERGRKKEREKLLAKLQTRVEKILKLPASMISNELYALRDQLQTQKKALNTLQD